MDKDSGSLLAAEAAFDHGPTTIPTYLTRKHNQRLVISTLSAQLSPHIHWTTLTLTTNYCPQLLHYIPMSGSKYCDR